jgi:hypothetical protein
MKESLSILAETIATSVLMDSNRRSSDLPCQGIPIAHCPAMFSLLPAVCVLLSCKQVKANVLVLGLANSGKTTLVNCLMEAGDQEVVPTVGFSMEKVHFDRCKLTVIDMSGQEKYQPLWEMHYTDAKVCITTNGSTPFMTALCCLQAFKQSLLLFSTVSHSWSQQQAGGTNSGPGAGSHACYTAQADYVQLDKP